MEAVKFHSRKRKVQLEKGESGALYQASPDVPEINRVNRFANSRVVVHQQNQGLTLMALKACRDYFVLKKFTL